MIRAERVLVVVLAALVAGCGYHLAGQGNSLAPHIKRIGVPTVQNLTPYPDLDRVFTEAVRLELSSRRQFVVVPDATGVDAVLTLSIQTLNAQVTAFTSDTKLASRYSVSVVLSGDFKDVKVDKPLWSKPAVRLVEDYDVPSGVDANDLTALFVQLPNALERIAKQFARSLVPQILTAW